MSFTKEEIENDNNICLQAIKIELDNVKVEPVNKQSFMNLQPYEIVMK